MPCCWHLVVTLTLMKGLMNASRIAWTLLMIAISALMLSCDGAQQPTPKEVVTQKKRPLIVCTTPLILEMVTFIADGKAEAVCLLKPGNALDQADLAAGDTMAMREADLILMHGVEQEAKLFETIQANAGKGRVQRLADIRGQPLSKTANPIVPSLAPADVHDLIVRVAAMVRALDPASFGDAESHDRPLHSEIEELTRWMATQMEAIDAAHRIVVTDDEMTASIIRGVGLTAVIVPRITGAVPTLADRNRLLASVRETKARAFAIKTSGSEAMTQMLQGIAKETGTRIVKPPLIAWPTAEVGYVAMMKANANALVAAVKE